MNLGILTVCPYSLTVAGALLVRIISCWCPAKVFPMSTGRLIVGLDAPAQVG